MAKENLIVVEGEVVESLPNVMFRVSLDCNGQTILCQLCGKMKQNFIKVMIGDKVEVEMSPYDLSKGRISKRLTKISRFEPTGNGKKKK